MQWVLTTTLVPAVVPLLSTSMQTINPPTSTRQSMPGMGIT
jgi:hypothetical protein